MKKVKIWAPYKIHGAELVSMVILNKETKDTEVSKRIKAKVSPLKIFIKAKCTW